ncbi:acyl carrier protein [Streptomyces sp. GESEQ-4]|uniref:acyl carrier protein n=1 Tax=Streptomyces sp. GESEQ-4 TaxID=2812655 RepID=UPI001B3274BC|nr:phosphopantetheine-binding protein [Streptomyces sp. GESEQ-4]
MDVQEQVFAVMRGVGFDGDELEADKRLAEDLDIDSTELVEIVVALEQHFDIAIDADAEGGFTTAGDLVGCVGRLLSAGTATRR